MFIYIPGSIMSQDEPPSQGGWFDASAPTLVNPATIYASILQEQQQLRAEVQALQQLVRQILPQTRDSRLSAMQQEQRMIRQSIDKLSTELAEMQKQITFICNDIKSENILERNRMLRTHQPVQFRPEHSQSYAQPLMPFQNWPLTAALLPNTGTWRTKLMSRVPSTVPSTPARTTTGSPAADESTNNNNNVITNDE